MALPVIAATYTGNSGNVSSKTHTVASVAAAAGEQLLVCFSAYGAEAGTSTISGVFNTSETLTLIRRTDQTDGSILATAAIYKLTNPTATTASVVFTTSLSLRSAVVVYRLSGVNAFGDDDGNGSTTNTVTVTLDTDADTLLFDVFGMRWGSGASVSIGANQTATYGPTGTGPGEFTYGFSTQDGSDGGVMSWTYSSTRVWALTAVAVQGAAAGGFVPYPLSSRTQGGLQVLSGGMR